MGRRSSCQAVSIVYSDLPHFILFVQCLYGTTVPGRSVALPPADEKTFLGMGRFLGVLRYPDAVTRCRINHPYGVADMFGAPVPAQAGLLVWSGATRHWRIVLSFFAFKTSNRWSSSVCRSHLACAPCSAMGNIWICGPNPAHGQIYVH